VAAADLVLAAGVTPVIAYNDVVALGLLSRFNARDIAVPEQLSVIGIDSIAMSEMVHPSLTTIDLDTELSGRAGVRRGVCGARLERELVVPAGGTVSRRLSVLVADGVLTRDQISLTHAQIGGIGAE
jgi:hypothetical protein